MHRDSEVLDFEISFETGEVNVMAMLSDMQRSYVSKTACEGKPTPRA